MDIFEKLKILTDSAKYDVACTSSGVERSAPVGDGIGVARSHGICHSFSADGRCISLLKVLMSNSCVFDCVYCKNRSSNDIPRATFTPKELADLTINFYKRNYIEGLFLSSGVVGSPNNTTELMIATIRILREEHRFYGYIHAKAIPGTDNELVNELGLLVDRMSVNIELPSSSSLISLAPDKSKESILKPMGFIKDKLHETKGLTVYNRGVSFNKGMSKFVPAGQSTQMMIGASPETDFSIIKLSEGLYDKFKLKRVFYSAYTPIVENSLLPSLETKPPLLRENRLYQADWLMRVYGFKAVELLDEKNPMLNPYVDPKCNWAVNNPGYFPIDVNRATYEMLLKVPGVGLTSARKIISARRFSRLNFEDLKKLGVVLKRAQYFLLCSGKTHEGIRINQSRIINSLLSRSALERFLGFQSGVQASMFDNFDEINVKETKLMSLTGQL
ncbi:MAG: putative DNA modification/repair radical SAM protein [Firmicutes bacterium]|nr:putative DNA modification/repair radical SAM protein [Bacillota bacterium]